MSSLPNTTSRVHPAPPGHLNPLGGRADLGRPRGHPDVPADPAPLPRGFAPLAWSNLGAQAAEQIALAAVPIFAVMALQAGPAEVGMLAAAQSLPFLLLALPLGLLADRGSRRTLMWRAEALRVVSLLTLAAVAWQGRAPLVLLALLGFVGAVGTVGFSVAAPALVASVVPRGQLGAANARLELARSLAFAAGPALAGALVTLSGAPAAFAVAALLSVLALLALQRVHEPLREPAPQRHPWHEVREGAAFVWRQPLLRPVLLTAVAWNLAWFVLQAAYVPYAMKTLGLDAAGVGFTLAVYGVGMVTGALAASRVIRRLPFGAAVLVGPLVSVAAIATLCASLLRPSPAFAAASMFLFGAGPILWTITSTTLRQQLTPQAMLGRVSAIFLTANSGARPVGAALGAAAGAAFGAEACLLLAAFGFVVQAALILTSPVRTLHALPVHVH